MGVCCGSHADDLTADVNEVQPHNREMEDRQGRILQFNVEDLQKEQLSDEGGPTTKRKEAKMVTKTQGEMDKIAAARGRGQRQGISAEVISQDTMENFVKPVHPKTPSQEAKLSDMVRQNEKFEVLAGTLAGEQLKDLVNAFFSKKVSRGEDVITQGAEGDLLYICEEGELDVYVARVDPDTGKMPDDKGDKVVTVGPGALFGELALMYSAPRAATVTVASDSATLWALERDAFKMLLVSKGQAKFQVYQGYLREVDLLSPFNNHELSAIADMMESVLFDTDESIITQGEVGESFFIVEDGTCAAFISGPTGEHQVKAYMPGDYFGEIALLTDEPRRATIKATGDGCSVLSISKDDFFGTFGPIKDTLKKNIDRYPKYAEFLKQ